LSTWDQAAINSGNDGGNLALVNGSISGLAGDVVGLELPTAPFMKVVDSDFGLKAALRHK
jgi:hypothetical protein